MIHICGLLRKYTNYLTSAVCGHINQHGIYQNQWKRVTDNHYAVLIPIVTLSITINNVFWYCALVTYKYSKFETIYMKMVENIEKKKLKVLNKFDVSLTKLI